VAKLSLAFAGSYSTDSGANYPETRNTKCSPRRHAQSTMANRVLILFAHPALQKSKVNRKLIAAVRNMENVTINDLYEEYPDFWIDVQREQELLLSHQIIVFQHPFYWYSCPPLLKQWEDLVLQYGFAFGAQGTKLKGKRVLTAITTGGSTTAYQRDGVNYFTVRELLTPFEQTVRFCGMVYLPPFVISGTLELKNEDEVAGYATLYRRAVESLRDGRFDSGEFDRVSYLNEILRPSPAAF
jgi:glutathione-regulated potassium-efflux system ancillary protein KefG